MLSRMQRQEIQREAVDLSALVASLYKELHERFPEQPMEWKVASGCVADADPIMMHSLFENLINNAWKYSSKNPQARVEFSVVNAKEGIPPGIGMVPETLPANETIFFVSDNGAGFDMAMAEELFGSFRRFHSDKQFEGTGIGLSTAKRIVERHGGCIWAHAEVNKGATFYFTLPG